MKNIASDYITHVHDPMAILNNDYPEEFFESIYDKIMGSILNTSYEEIIDAIDKSNPVLEIKTIPIFYNFYDGSYGICQYLSTVKNSTYIETGAHFTNEGNRATAKQKYGEIHLKMGASLGLVILFKPYGQKTIGANSPLGTKCAQLPMGDFFVMIPKLILRIPIIAALIKKSRIGIINIQDVMRDLGMKETTIERRTQSVKILINNLKNVSCEPLQKRLSYIR